MSIALRRGLTARGTNCRLNHGAELGGLLVVALLLGCSSPFSDRYKELDATRLKSEQGAVARYLSGGAPENAKFRQRIGEISTEAALAKKENMANNGNDFLKSNEPPTDPNKLALWQYYDSFNATDASGALDFDAQRQAKLAEYTRGWDEAQKQYVGDRRGTEHVPEAAKLAEDQRAISDAGFWGIRDTAWQWLQKTSANPVYDKYPTYEAWYKANMDSIVPKMVANGIPQDSALDQARGLIDKSSPAKEFDTQRMNAKRSWVMKNQDTARLAFHWGYISDNETRDYLYPPKKR